VVLVDYKFNPDRNQETGLFFKNLAPLPDTQKIASAFRFSSDLMTHESLNVKHASSPEEPTAQHLDTLIARAFNQSIAYEKHLMNDDPSVQHNLLEKTLRVITKSMFGAAQNIIAMPGNVRVLGSQLRHHPIDTTGTIAKAVCHKVGTVFYTVGSFLNALNTIKVRHDTLINKENCEFIEAFNPGWTAALEEEQKIDCRAIADTIASFSEEDMQKYIVQPFIEAHMVAGILKTAKAIHPVVRKFATAAEIESDQPGGSWRTPQELGDLVRHRFTTQAESEVLVPELVTHVPTTARSLGKLLPSRFVPPSSAQPGFLDISPKKIAGGLAVNRLITRADLEELVGNQIEQASKLTFTIPEKIMKLAPTTKQYPKLDGEHMYLPEINIHPETGNTLKLAGFHIDPNGVLEKSGLVKIEKIDTIKLKDGASSNLKRIIYRQKSQVKVQ
jgi:hypothetical protein